MQASALVDFKSRRFKVVPYIPATITYPTSKNSRRSVTLGKSLNAPSSDMPTALRCFVAYIHDLFVFLRTSCTSSNIAPPPCSLPTPDRIGNLLLPKIKTPQEWNMVVDNIALNLKWIARNAQKHVKKRKSFSCANTQTQP